MIQPALLQQGDTVAIVATARKISREEIQPAINLLEQWGLNVVVGKTIGASYHQFAGTDKERANDLQHALDDDSIKAIWCARGGYGTVRIIDRIDFSQFIKQPKWLLGFSDVTVLHSQIHKFGIQTIHSLMPITVKNSSVEALDSLQEVIFNGSCSYTVASTAMNKLGVAEGELVGGNLSMLYSMLGSSSSINTDGKILFIEDLDEYLYHIDRMLMNLKRNGYFDDLKGLIVGGMTDMHDNTITFGATAQEIIQEQLKTYSFPICYDFPAGHLSDNRSLLFGKSVELVVTEENTQLKF